MPQGRVEVLRRFLDFLLTIRLLVRGSIAAVALLEGGRGQAVLVAGLPVDEGECVGDAQAASEVVLYAPSAGGEVGADLVLIGGEEFGEADYFPKSAPWILARMPA